MTATTAPAQDDATLPPMELVSTPASTIDYMARREGLRLTMKSRYPIRNPVTGAAEGVTQGIFCGFRNGLLRVPKEGEVTLLDTLNGGSHIMDAAEVHKWLRRHPLCGDRTEGFWPVEEVAPPVTRTELDRILAAAAEWDDVTLRAILEAETAGWGREDVLSVVQGSLERIENMRRQAEEASVAAEAQAAQEHEARVRAEETLAAAQAMAAEAEKKAAAAEKRAAAAEKKAKE